MKRKSIFLLLAFFLLIVIRGPLYRLLVRYEDAGSRREYSVTSPELQKQLDNWCSEAPCHGINDLIANCHRLTANTLHFSTARGAAADPNRLVHAPAANCIGYAAYFATAFNYAVERCSCAPLADWKAEPRVAKLFAGGYNVHRVLDSGFWRDHDFVLIKNARTGEAIAVDPSLYDYLRVETVRF